MVPTTDEDIVIVSRHQGIELHGTLNVPRGARGLVVFAHGSGSSRNSPRNRQVAATLNRAGEGYARRCTKHIHLYRPDVIIFYRLLQMNTCLHEALTLALH